MREDFTDLLGFSVAIEPARKEQEEPIPEEETFDQSIRRINDTKRAENTIRRFSDVRSMVKFINASKTMAFEAIDDFLVHGGYAAVAWHFRSAALAGDLPTAKAAELWLRWAGLRTANQKRGREDPIKNPNADAFGPREPDEK